MKMKARVINFLDNIHSSYWFLPSLMALSTVILSFLTLEMDYKLASNGTDTIRWLYTGSPEGGRTILSTIASSMIGIAGVVFSITIVALTLASNQFGPRLLRNFMRDRANQTVLGTFISAFLFSIFILRRVQGDSDGAVEEFVPQISIAVSVALSVASLGVLIFFIHHISLSIQAPQVILEVCGELKAAIREMYPEEIGEDHDNSRQLDWEFQQKIPKSFESESCFVCAENAGYIKRIEPEQLLNLAKQHDLLIRIEHSPGEFVIAGEPVFRIWPARRMNGELAVSFSHFFVIGHQRTVMQDVDFPIEQLVEIAVRALSPGVNDPFTAIMCIERLGEGLAFLGQQKIPSPYRLDDDGVLRVIAPHKDFGELCDLAFEQLRRSARDSFFVLLAMLKIQRKVIGLLHRQTDIGNLTEHMNLVREAASSIAKTPRELGQIEKAFARPEKTDHRSEA